MRTHYTVGALAVALLLAASPARADGQAAVNNFYGNLSRAGMALSLKKENAKVENTLVRGLYALLAPNGDFAGYINEAGTLRGDSNGMEIMPTAGGQQARKMTAAEQASFRAEVMNAIDYDKLVKVNYGRGSARKLIMFSAVDCGYCQRLEQDLARFGDKIDVTFYVVPMSLKAIKHGGAAQMQTVAKIWCADDQTGAWKKYWENLTPPPASGRACAFDAQTAERQAGHLANILKAAGIAVRGTPSYLREDGTLLSHRSKIDIAYVNQNFGSAGAVPTPANPQQWLVAGAAPVPGAAETATAEPQQGPKKIKLNEALKSLFN